MIDTQLAQRLHPMLGGIARDLECHPLAINGTADHVLVLVRVPPKLSQADLVRHVKSRSSKWVHETFPAHGSFAWQEGGGGLTVSASMVESVRVYIERQAEHHRRMSFKDELPELLRRHGVEFGPEGVFRD